MNTKLLALYGLKWHPFTTEVPTEAIHVPARLEHFCWRIEQGLGSSQKTENKAR